ncbi:4-alpha-glucanotransferase [bacterium]|nr:4-alpha-glucanotransferase [bacterium]
MAEKKINPRKAGIILHPTSLPGRRGTGDFGASAYDFVDFLADSAIRIWQILPLTPTGADGCPYNSFSAFAGNEILIDIDELIDKKLVEMPVETPEFSDYRVDYPKVIKFKSEILDKAAEKFYSESRNDAGFAAFMQENSGWINDFALFRVLTKEFEGKSWKFWPAEFRNRDKNALEKFASSHEQELFRHFFAQYLFFSQWKKLKEYANEKGIEIMGDIPIFLSFDSADVWANQHIFKMTDAKLSEVAGVPPDYFSADGQLWGNPLYDWIVLEKEDFSWWIDRFLHNLKLYDILRLDHFRGFSAYWSVPATETTAKNGHWEKGPGTKLFDTLFKRAGKIPIVAEDLGDIDVDVVKLRETCGFAGMKVLQFAFYEGTDHEFLPHNYTNTNCVCYTGTHDNDTTVGWFWSLSDGTKSFVTHYLGSNGDDIHWKMIRLAMSSIAEKALFPLQDVLGWGGDCRFNVPGTTGPQNWTWRFQKDSLTKYHSDLLRGIVVAFNRESKTCRDVS